MLSQVMRKLLAVSAIVAVFLASGARAQESFQLPPLSDNAALQYYQAFATMPALTADQEKLLENWNTTPLGVGTSKLLDGCHTSFAFLHKAAARSECDWGLNYDEGISMHLPHLGKARTLARLAMLDVRRSLAAGNINAVGERLGDVMAMARRVGEDYTLVSMLVCFAMENMVVDAVAPHVPELGIPYDDAVQNFDSLPPRPRLVHSVMCEKRLAASIVRQLQEAEAKQPGSWRGVWQSMASPGVPTVLKDVKSLDQIVTWANDFQGVYDELAELVELPPKEFDAKFPDFAKRAREISPIAELLLPAMDRVIATQRRTETRLALLMAGIAVAESGPDALEEIKDPFGDGPIEYRKLDDGFELSSKLVYEGGPVKLTFGAAAAAAK
jgi:hypothetical protein